MNNIVLNKRQSRELAQAIRDGIRSHCDNNLERFLLFYLKERENAKGKQLEPIRIKFYPISHFVEQYCIDDNTNQQDFSKGFNDESDK